MPKIEKTPAKRRKPEWKCGLSAYSTIREEAVTLEELLSEMTEESIDDGESYCVQTVSDLVSCCRSLHERLKARERLFRLCFELDIEMDGVRVPGTAAAILNAIRSIVTDKE